MTQEFRLFFWFVVAIALVIAGVWAAYRLFFAKRADGAPPPAPDTPSGSVELLHLERDAEGRTRIRLKGRDVSGADAIGDPRLSAAVRTLMAVLGGEAAGAGAGPPAPDVPSPALPDDAMRRPLAERVRESFARPQAYPAEPARKPEPGAAGAVWMFERINEIVEQLRRDAPGVPEIELSGEGEQIRVWLSGQAYRGIDDVPDERARALIRAAIAQWERE